MGVTVSKCLQVDYELFELEDHEKPITITSWSLSEPASTHDSFTLQELSASKYQFPFDTSGYASDCKFTQKCIDCAFSVGRALMDVRVMTTMELDGEQFDGLELKARFSKEIAKATWKETVVGDLEVGEHHFKQLVYLAAAMSQRILHVFITSSNTIVMKARLMLAVPEECRGGYIASPRWLDEQAMRERESRLQDIILASTSDSPFFALHHPDHLAEAIAVSQSVRRPAPTYLLAPSDATSLAMRCYEPPQGNVAAVIIIPCTNNSFFMDALAARLAESHHIAAVVAELRGFGHSGGKRGGGDASHPDTLFTDCRSIIRHGKWSHPNVPVLLAAHFLMAGLVLNYVEWRGADAVDGIVLLAPHFGQASRHRVRAEMRERLRDNNMIKANRLALMVAQWSGGRFGGRRRGVSLPVDDNAMSVNPMLVNHFSASLVMAWNCQNPPATMRRLRIPTLTMLGAHDEFFDTCMLEWLTATANNRRHRTTVIPTAANLTLLTNSQSIDELAKFALSIRTKEAVLTVIMRAIGGTPTTANTTDTGPEILNQLGQQVRQAQSSGVRHYPTHHLESHDGLKLAFNLFRPVSTPSTTSAVIIFLAPIDFCTVLVRLCQEHGVIGVRFDPRGSGQSGGRPGHVADRHLLFNDIARMIRQARLSFPGRPLFLGGVVGGASLAINYVNSDMAVKQPGSLPAGLFLINPLVEPGGTFGTPQSRDMFKKEPISLFKRLLRFKSKIALNPQVSAVLQTGLYNAEFFTAHLLAGDAVREANKALSLVPGYLLLSKDFSLANNDSLYAALHEKNNHLLTELQLTTGDLVHILQQAVDHGGPWMSRLAASMSPSPLHSLSLLTIASLSDISMGPLIGHGAFGMVWLGRVRDDGYVAVKVLPKAMLHERGMEEAVRQEASCMQLMRHSPHTVSLIAAFEDRKAVYLVMDYLIGGELLTLMMRRGRLPWNEAAFYLHDIAAALHDMHTAGIVYRDLKPENVLLDAVGHARLVDFGFAERIGQGRSMRFCGSPFYVAPEMLVSGRGSHDLRVDWWAAGALLFEMLTGRPPFVGDTANAVYKQTLFFGGGRSAVKRLVPSAVHLEEDVIDVLAGLLQPDPDKRSGFEEVCGGRAMRRVDSKQPPFAPAFSAPGDTSNFVKRSEQRSCLEWVQSLPETDYFIGVLHS